MSSYDEARANRFDTATTLTVVALPLSVSDDQPMRQTGHSPYCICAIEPCPCPDEGPIVWWRDADIVSSRALDRRARNDEQLHEYRLKPDTTVLVESLDALPISALLAGPPGTAVQRSYGAPQPHSWAEYARALELAVWVATYLSKGQLPPVGHPINTDPLVWP